MTNPSIIDTNDFLLALVPTLGPYAARYATLGEVKWAGSAPLVVEQSMLEFTDEAGRIIGRKENAFGLEPGSQLIAPYSKPLMDESPRPLDGFAQRWRLNDWVVESLIKVPVEDWNNLYVAWFPLQLPLARDMHLVVGLVNLDLAPLDIARGLREAVCWVDGIAWQSTAGRVWNTRYLVDANHSTRRHFCLCDFSGLSLSGRHEMYIELLGRRSRPEVIAWHDAA